MSQIKPNDGIELWVNPKDHLTESEEVIAVGRDYRLNAPDVYLTIPREIIAVDGTQLTLPPLGDTVRRGITDIAWSVGVYGLGLTALAVVQGLHSLLSTYTAQYRAAHGLAASHGDMNVTEVLKSVRFGMLPSEPSPLSNQIAMCAGTEMKDPSRSQASEFLACWLMVNDAPGLSQAQAAAPVAGRRGPRYKTKSPEIARYPYCDPAREFFALLASGEVAAGREGLIGTRGNAQMGVPYDHAVGFSSENALAIFEKDGAALIQTMLAAANFWCKHKPGAPRTEYLFGVTAGDILRSMNKKPKANGGYDREDVERLGWRLWLLSNTTWVETSTQRVQSNRLKDRTILHKLIVLDTPEFVTYRDAEGRPVGKSSVDFNFHLGQPLHQWVAGEEGQFTEATSKILKYNPHTHKYHILIGLGLICLAQRQENEYPLSSLLREIGVTPATKKGFLAFEQIQKAVGDLREDPEYASDWELVTHAPASASGMERIAKSRIVRSDKKTKKRTAKKSLPHLGKIPPSSEEKTAQNPSLI